MLAPVPPPPSPHPATAPARQIDSTTLLGPRGEVFIIHREQVYRLRVTSQGKLILTK
ncbi:hemin uptake protein HemP [Roseateles cellulosilyticus]|uniref:Hemin uptake protein HemP n=1 Tax=Pelomonas cellulosilytica TaxID=2906762 RepID=A0ABS8XRQ5_9BURK|nr:hemin uptake protein HemP [Pelomonas sp. P8]MCE4553364.1 hemin uptake protein HemP [Pelomonas sp. P8]